MVDGWIKLFRKVLDSGWLRNHKLWVFWSYCLLKASHKDHSQLVGFTQVELRSGQFVFGRKQASIDLNMTQQSIRTCLKNLKKAGNLTIKSTNKYSIVTICNWEFYQNDQLAIQPAKQQASNQQVTSKQPASNQQVTTNKNERMEESKNVNNNISNCPNCNSTKIRIKKKRKGKYKQVIYCEDCKCEFIKENDEIKIIKKGTDFEAIECFDQYYKLHPNSENIFYQKPVALKMFQNLLKDVPEST